MFLKNYRWLFAFSSPDLLMSPWFILVHLGSSSFFSVFDPFLDHRIGRLHASSRGMSQVWRGHCSELSCKGIAPSRSDRSAKDI